MASQFVLSKINAQAVADINKFDDGGIGTGTLCREDDATAVVSWNSEKRRTFLTTLFRTSTYDSGKVSSARFLEIAWSGEGLRDAASVRVVVTPDNGNVASDDPTFFSGLHQIGSI